MQNIVETQHNRMYSLYIGSLCNVTFPMARFTCIVTSQVFVEIWMRWSIALSSAFYTGKKHLWIVFSFKNRSEQQTRNQRGSICWIFGHTQPFTFLDKSTRPILPLVVLSLSTCTVIIKAKRGERLINIPYMINFFPNLQTIFVH